MTMPPSTVGTLNPQSMGDECTLNAQSHNASGGREELPPTSAGGEHSQPAGVTGSPPVASLNGPKQVPGQALASQIIGLEASQSSQASYETSDRVTQNPETDRLRLYIHVYIQA